MKPVGIGSIRAMATMATVAVCEPAAGRSSGALDGHFTAQSGGCGHSLWQPEPAGWSGVQHGISKAMVEVTMVLAATALVDAKPDVTA